MFGAMIFVMDRNKLTVHIIYMQDFMVINSLKLNTNCFRFGFEKVGGGGMKEIFRRPKKINIDDSPIMSLMDVYTYVVLNLASVSSIFTCVYITILYLVNVQQISNF